METIDPRYAGELRNQPQGATGKFARQREQEDAYWAKVRAEHERNADRVGAGYDSRGKVLGRLDTLPLSVYRTHAGVHDTMMCAQPNRAAATDHRTFDRGFDAARTTGRNPHDAATLVLRENPGAWEAHRAGDMSGDDNGAASNACADLAFSIANRIQQIDPTIARQDALSAAWREVQKTELYQRMRAEQQLV